MAYILYDKKGEKKIIHHLVDCRELLATGNFFKKDPTLTEGEKPEGKPGKESIKPGTVEAEKRAQADALGIEQAPPVRDPGEKKTEERRPEDNIVYKNAGAPFAKAAQTGKK